MAFYVYIIESEVDNTLYKGYTEDYNKRLSEHNAGLSTSRVKVPGKSEKIAVPTQ